MNIKESILESKLWHWFGRSFPTLATRILYKKAIGETINLKNPLTLNEKMQWLKLNVYCKNDAVAKCADKYKVREYIAEKGCEEILNDLIGVWENVEDIAWDILPEKFVLKCTHGSGYNIICTDRKKFDKEKAMGLLKKWMNETYGQNYCELIYSNITPRIIAEKYIETEDGKAPTDYKFFCSYGDPKFLYVMVGNDEMQDYYTSDWKWLPVKSGGRPNANQRIEKPKRYNEMLKYASLLSEEFPLVRVDFYYEKDEIIFGEMTFLTTGGFTKYEPSEYDRIFGDLFPPVHKKILKNK